jgi:hypothetical protein
LFTIISSIGDRHNCLINCYYYGDTLQEKLSKRPATKEAEKYQQNIVTQQHVGTKWIYTFIPLFSLVLLHELSFHFFLSQQAIYVIKVLVDLAFL